ncbi:MAG: nitroreductase [Deltaproteobacteria bacterium]|nr:nitroreductase [Deltaproteobacteria bacterium]
MTFEETVKTRRSVRGFLDRPVPQKIITEAFELAQLSPSNSNIQPWQVFVASGITRDAIRELLIAQFNHGFERNSDFSYPERFDGPYRKRQIDCAVKMWTEMGITREDKIGRISALLRNFELFDAPHIAFFCMEKSFTATVAVDLGIYAQTLMLALTSLGISSCAMGSMRNWSDIPREIFGFGENLGVVFGMAFGFEDTALPVNNLRMTRSPVTECVTFKD